MGNNNNPENPGFCCSRVSSNSQLSRVAGFRPRHSAEATGPEEETQPRSACSGQQGCTSCTPVLGGPRKVYAELAALRCPNQLLACAGRRVQKGTTCSQLTSLPAPAVGSLWRRLTETHALKLVISRLSAAPGGWPRVTIRSTKNILRAASNNSMKDCVRPTHQIHQSGSHHQGFR